MGSSDSLPTKTSISTGSYRMFSGCYHHPIDRVSHVHCVSLNACRSILRRKAIPLLLPASSRYVTEFNLYDNFLTFACMTTLYWIRFMLRPTSCLELRSSLSPGFSSRCRSSFRVNWPLPWQIPFNLLEYP